MQGTRSTPGVRSGRLCACGCGEETFLIQKTALSKGRVKGQPNKYLNGHWAAMQKWLFGEDRAAARRKRSIKASTAVFRRRFREDPDFREYVRAAGRRRRSAQRARIRAAFVEQVDSLVVLERDDGVCGICGEDVDPLRFDVDHIVPLARGGEHSYANTQPAHVSCNRSKRDEHHGD